MLLQFFSLTKKLFLMDMVLIQTSAWLIKNTDFGAKYITSLRGKKDVKFSCKIHMTPIEERLLYYLLLYNNDSKLSR